MRASAIALLALMMSFFALSFQALPAHAADCTPDATTGCVQGIIKTTAGDPAVDVELELTGKGVQEAASTDANGRWSFPITEAGEYTVSVNTDSLPDGQYRESNVNPRRSGRALRISKRPVPSDRQPRRR